MEFLKPKSKRETKQAEDAAGDLMNAMGEIAKSKTIEERRTAVKKFKLVGKVIHNLCDLPKRTVHKGLMLMGLKARKKKQPKIIRASAEEEEFFSEAPFDEELRLLALTDLGMAWRLVGRPILFDYTRKAWLVYDGQRWNTETGNAYATRAAQRISKRVVEEVNALTHLQPRLKLEKIKEAFRRQQKNAIESMLKLAQSLKDFETYTNKFDKDPWLLNCKNGTINLKTETVA